MKKPPEIGQDSVRIGLQPKNKPLTDGKPSPWQTPEQVAQLLGVDVAVIRGELENGHIQGVNIDGAIRISPNALREFLDEASIRPKRVQPLGRFRFLVIGAALALAAAFGAVTVVYAQASSDPASVAVPYQGYLEEAGVAVEGPKWVTFRLYPEVEGGEAVWVEEHEVTVLHGRFSASLGSKSPLDDALRNAGNLYVEVSVDGMTKEAPAGKPVVLAGRQAFGSVPFARRGAPGKKFVADYLVVAPEAAPDEGGEVQLEGSSSFPSVGLDNFRGSFRVRPDDKVALEVDATETKVRGNLVVANGSEERTVTVHGSASIDAALYVNNLVVQGSVSGTTRAFGGQFQVDDCWGCTGGNPYANGSCACPEGFTGSPVGRVTHPESKCGSTLALCVR
jgi:hypothetical protein